MATHKAYSDSLISWVGGKKQLRTRIAEMIPDDIRSYIEPFGGAGWVLFYKKRWATVEVYNDINGDLVNLFKVAKFHPDALQKEFRLLIPSRELFYQVKDNPGFTDIHRATRFLYLIHRSFGALMGSFGTSRISGVKSQKNILIKIDQVSHRLDKVIIENKPYDELIRMYDRSGAFFFLDPPYLNGYDYGLDFDHEHLAEVLAGIQGRWILTLDDCDDAHKLFGNYPIQSVTRQKGIDRKHGSLEYSEVIITNYSHR